MALDLISTPTSAVPMKVRGAVNAHHFHISAPRYDDYFELQLNTSIGRLSTSFLSVDDHRLSIDDEGSQVIRVRLRLSAKGQRENKTLEWAISKLCNNMVMISNRPQVETLTTRSISGIVPLSDMFNTYWIAAFFTEAMTYGPNVSQFLSELQREAGNYVAPFAAVLIFAVFAGVGSCFSFLSVAGPLHDPASIAQFCGAAFAGVSDYLGDMADIELATMTLTQREAEWNQALARFKTAYDELLGEMVPSSTTTTTTTTQSQALVPFQRSSTARIPYHLCPLLCNLTVQASRMVKVRKPLFEAIRANRAAALSQMTTHAFTAGAATWALGGTLVMGAELVGEAVLLDTAVGAGVCAAGFVCAPLALMAGALLVKNIIKVNDAVKEQRAMKEKEVLCAEVWNVMILSWDTAFQMRMFMEWFRLSGGDGTSTQLQFRDEGARHKWETFLAKYREAGGSSGGQSSMDVRTLQVVIEEMAHNLAVHRETLRNLS